MAVTSAISDFFASIFELISSVFKTAYAIVHSILTAAVNFVSGVFTLITDLFSGVVDVAGGIGKFVFGRFLPASCSGRGFGKKSLTCVGNIVVVALVGAGVFAYMRYTAQGQKLATGKKTN